MKKNLLQKGLLLILICILTSGLRVLNCNAESSLHAPANVKIWRHSNTSLRLKWSKVKQADGYIVYKYDKKTKAFKKYKIIKNKNTRTFIDKVGSRKSAYYKISAYKKIASKKVTGNQSAAVSAKTYKIGDSKVNVAKVRTKIKGSGYYYEEMAFHETLQLSSSLKPGKSGKAKNKKVLSETVSWHTTNPKIAVVDENGLVTAQSNIGTCYIYARAHNGRHSTTIKIIVENYAKPRKDNLVLWPAEDDPDKYGSVLEMFNGFFKDVTDIAEYFSINRPQNGEVFECWLEKGQIQMSRNYYITPGMEKKIYNFMEKFPYVLHIYATADYVAFNEMYGAHEENRKAIINAVYVHDKNKKNPYSYKEVHEIDINWEFGALK